MKNRSHSARAAAALALLFSLVWAANAQSGEYTAAAVDAGVRLAADFAVKEQSAKTKKSISLETILVAEDGPAKLGGRNLRLCLVVGEDGRATSAMAVVTMDQYANLKLVSWKASSCTPAANSEFTTVALPDAGVELAADFAVKERSEQTKTTVILTGVVKAEDGEAKLGARNLRLCMRTVVNGETASANVVVTVDQYSNYKLVSWTDASCGFKVSEVDPGVELAADFAVKERAEKTKTKIAKATIIKAEDGEAKLGARNLRLCLKTKVNGKLATVQVVVTVDQYNNYKLVSWSESGCGAK